MISRITLFFIAALACGCVSTLQPGTAAVPGGTKAILLGESFDLGAGQTGRLGELGLSVTFDSVAQDSRCPSDVQCVWAGDAAVALTLRATGDSPVSATIHTGLNPKSTTYAGTVVTVNGLAPGRKSGTSIPPEKYVVTLLINRP